MKTEFVTGDVAKAGGEELKWRFPEFLIKIYDAETKTREQILPSGI